MDLMEMKSATEALAVAFEHYKQANDERLEQVERKNGSDVLIDDKLRRLDGEINRLQDVVTKVKTAAARPVTSQKSRWNEPQADEHEQAFLRYIAKGDDHGLYQFESKASVISDADGGFLVPADMGDRILTRMVDITPMRSLATVLTTTSDALELVRDSGDGEAVWVSETTAAIDTNGMSFGKIRIQTNDLHAMPRASQRFLDDATLNVEEFIVNKVASRFAKTESAAFVSGTGVGQPRGFATYGVAATSDATRAWGTFEYVPSGANGALAASNPGDQLISLIYKLRAGYQPGASFMMPRALAEDIRKLRDTTGNYLWAPSLTAGQPATLLGFPVTLSEDMPAKATNALSVAFGNFREAYTIVDRLGIRVFRDPYTAAPFVKFRCTRRVGGDVTNFEAIKFLRLSST